MQIEMLIESSELLKVFNAIVMSNNIELRLLRLNILMLSWSRHQTLPALYLDITSPRVDFTVQVNLELVNLKAHLVQLATNETFGPQQLILWHNNALA